MFLFVVAGASRFFDAIAANDQELVCQALGIKYEVVKSAHTDNDDMDTTLAHKLMRPSDLGVPLRQKTQLRDTSEL